MENSRNVELVMSQYRSSLASGFKAMVSTAGKDKIIFAIENKLPLLALSSRDVSERTLCQIIEYGLNQGKCVEDLASAMEGLDELNQISIDFNYE